MGNLEITEKQTPSKLKNDWDPNKLTRRVKELEKRIANMRRIENQNKWEELYSKLTYWSINSIFDNNDDIINKATIDELESGKEVAKYKWNGTIEKRLEEIIKARYYDLFRNDLWFVYRWIREYLRQIDEINKWVNIKLPINNEVSIDDLKSIRLVASRIKDKKTIEYLNKIIANKFIKSI